MRPGLPNAQALVEARSRLAGIVRETPLQLSPWLSELTGHEVFLKLECWQRTGSFKLRGAYNAVAALGEEARRSGLIAASAGNHGQALALAASLFGATATVVVPASAPETKKRRIVAFGAALREVAGTYDDAAVVAAEMASETGAHMVHGFSDPDVVAGQGTVGLEIIEAQPAVRDVLVPVGGGGLAAGVGIACRALTGAGTRVLGVQSEHTCAMHAAFEAGRVVPTPWRDTLCDGLAGEVEEESYERARPVVNGIHLVPEDRIAPAIRALYDHEGVVAEGSGVVGVAALMAGVLEIRGPAAVVISGGNIDARDLARILSES